MFAHYFSLGLRTLRRNPMLTALMVLTLAMGVAASVSTLTILHVMSGDPIPHKSGRLFVPLVDVGPAKSFVPGSEPDDNQSTYKDAMNFLASGQGQRRAAMLNVGVSIQPERADLGLVRAQGLAPTLDFFAMFETPFQHGGPWSPEADAGGVDVVVLSRALSEKLYGQENPVGKRVRMFDSDFQVVGVTQPWRPLPHYYRMVNGNGGAFGEEDGFFIPFRTAIRHELRNNGNTSCSAQFPPGYQGFLDSECTWLQFWFETGSSLERGRLLDYLNGYVAEQRKLGRMQRPGKAQLFNVMEWMDYLHAVGNDSKLSAWLAFGFLALCLVNTVGLLLAKFSTRAAEVGIRRALGASRGDIFRQFLVETSVVGVVGGVLGLVLSFGGLWLIGLQSKELAAVAHMDWVMLGVTFVLSVSAALLAGLFPTWRACQVTPAIQLKSQ